MVPEWNGPETVKIVVLDANGEAANPTLQQAVYDYIMSPDSPIDRLAPPNVILTVSAPELVNINYVISGLSLEDGFEEENVLAEFEKALSNYYKNMVSEDGEVKYIWVHSTLTNTAGVEDFEGLKMNGSTENITIDMDEYPFTKSVTTEEVS